MDIQGRASKLGAPEGARSRHVVNQFVCVVGNVLLYIYISRLEGQGVLGRVHLGLFKVCVNVCAVEAF